MGCLSGNLQLCQKMGIEANVGMFTLCLVNCGREGNLLSYLKSCTHGYFPSIDLGLRTGWEHCVEKIATFSGQ